MKNKYLITFFSQIYATIMKMKWRTRLAFRMRLALLRFKHYVNIGGNVS